MDRGSISEENNTAESLFTDDNEKRALAKGAHDLLNQQQEAADEVIEEEEKEEVEEASVDIEHMPVVVEEATVVVEKPVITVEEHVDQDKEESAEQDGQESKEEETEQSLGEQSREEFAEEEKERTETAVGSVDDILKEEMKKIEESVKGALGVVQEAGGFNPSMLGNLKDIEALHRGVPGLLEEAKDIAAVEIESLKSMFSGAFDANGVKGMPQIKMPPELKSVMMPKKEQKGKPHDKKPKDKVPSKAVQKEKPKTKAILPRKNISDLFLFPKHIFSSLKNFKEGALKFSNMIGLNLESIKKHLTTVKNFLLRVDGL
ncbi:hypothetical protein C922_02263, partial [Plasmodium inui San Antonio 1]